MQESRSFHMDVWTDVGCPLCYVQLPVLDALRDEYRDALSFRWRAFEANPVGIAKPACPAPSYIEIFEAAIPLAEARGMTLRLPAVLSRTGKALEAIAAAEDAGVADAMYRAISKAHFVDGVDIEGVDALVEIGSACGLPAGVLRDALDRGRFKSAIDADRALAQALGATGLPFVVISKNGPEPVTNASIAVRGTAPIEHYRVAIDELFGKA